jgi:hypothetical protein
MSIRNDEHKQLGSGSGHMSAGRSGGMPGRSQLMSTATRRATSRKAMRVATVFTGAAATAVAFAPAALAAPGHAPAQGHTALVNGKTRAVRPDNTGSIRSKGCGTSDVHWLHIEYASFFRSKLCKAFGFRGYMTDGQDMYAQCGGNNYGNIFGSKGTLSFGPGNTYRSFPRRNISAVSIYFWSGTDQCRWPR